MESFVDASQIDPRYYEKPYLLVPGKKAEKGYVLLRETLRSTGKVGIARVVVRTREYLCAVMPHEDALVLMILRYPQELVDPEEYKLPTGKLSDYRITSKETAMAEQLIESMAGDWDPSQYHDEFRERLQQVLNKRIKSKGVPRGSTMSLHRARTPAPMWSISWRCCRRARMPTSARQRKDGNAESSHQIHGKEGSQEGCEESCKEDRCTPQGRLSMSLEQYRRERRLAAAQVRRRRLTTRPRRVIRRGGLPAPLVSSGCAATRRRRTLE